ncbi:MAG TPA: T9SS type A sorting domain-containing protein, partial [Rhodothermia bacterium]|nr:T9SS type A sorting domain-containing protein [Rhodothermia bacterium]
NEGCPERIRERAGFQKTGTAAEPAGELPSGDFKVSAFPNPFGTTFVLTFELSVPAPVDLSIFDALGRRVVTLIDGVRPAGLTTVTVDGSSWPQGVYHFVFRAGDVAHTGRIIHVR